MKKSVITEERVEILHGARRLQFDDLHEGLRQAKSKRLVNERASGDLRLYCYSPSCVYDSGWDKITTLARGLVLDIADRRVVATPFPKFFNVGERGETIPDLPFETFDKHDGSLIIIWHYGEQWRCATKGRFDTEPDALQAHRALSLLRRHDLSGLTKGSTYLAEYVGPENKIVVHYDTEELVLLAAYDEGGAELSYAELLETAGRLGWRTAERHAFLSVSDLIAHAAGLPKTAEGFVLRFSNGHRLKVKGDAYRRIHALISRCTPLAMWEAMLAGDDMADIRRQLPEEFWADFDAITSRLDQDLRELQNRTELTVDGLKGLPDKEVGLRLKEFPEEIRGFIFPCRRQGSDWLSGRTREAAFRAIRPTGNELEGYTPSYAMKRVADEAI